MQKKTAAAVSTKRECAAQVRKHLAHWQRALGLLDWEVAFEFRREAGDTRLQNDNSAYVHIQSTLRYAKVVFDERCDPTRYEYIACHELLHVLWHTLGTAIDKLEEPSRSVVDDAHHWALEKVARLLTSTVRPCRAGGSDVLSEPPWR